MFFRQNQSFPSILICRIASESLLFMLDFLMLFQGCSFIMTVDFKRCPYQSLKSWGELLIRLSLDGLTDCHNHRRGHRDHSPMAWKKTLLRHSQLAKLASWALLCAEMLFLWEPGLLVFLETIITKKLLHRLSLNVCDSIVKWFSKPSNLIMRCNDTDSCVQKLKYREFFYFTCLFTYFQILQETLSGIINMALWGRNTNW